MRRRRWIRRVRAIAGTVALGGLLGFLVPTVISDFSPRTDAVIPTSDESPIAREFIDAFVRNDQPRLRQLGANEMESAMANSLASSVAKVGPPVLLGVKALPGFSMQAYASPVVLADGSQSVLSWRVWMFGGLPALIPPPKPLDSSP
jgi:hypothetical protein